VAFSSKSSDFWCDSNHSGILYGLDSGKIFKLKLWDYSDDKFNLHGRVSLLFSTLWTVLAVVFITVIHPTVSHFVQALSPSSLNSFSIIFLAYGMTDCVFSIISMTSFRRKMAYLYTEYFNLSNAEVESLFGSLKRLTSAFPNLSKSLYNNVNVEIKNKIGSF